MNKWTTRKLRYSKINHQFDRQLSMLTCYDYQTAQLLNESDVDLLLVGDSLGNVILGHKTTVSVTLEEMIIFGRAVKRGAPDKFTVVDLPFGTYGNAEIGLQNGIRLFQETEAESLKLEGASPEALRSIELLTQSGVPVMGHIGLTPQSIHQQGGYFTHGKTKDEIELLIKQAKEIQKAGAFCLVLECVTSDLSKLITESLDIPTIGIGSGEYVDGQVLVINDLLGLGKLAPPSFCKPIANLYAQKKELLESYHQGLKKNDESTFLHH